MQPSYQTVNNVDMANFPSFQRPMIHANCRGKFFENKECNRTANVSGCSNYMEFYFRIRKYDTTEHLNINYNTK